MHVHLGVEGLLPLLLYSGMLLAFLASVFWRPAIGLYVLAFALPMQTGRYKIHNFFLGSQFVDVLILGAILGLMIKGESVIPRSSITKFLLLFSVFYYFSLWEGSFFIDAPLPIWITDTRFSDWKNYVEMFLLALVIAGAIKDKRQVGILLTMMCLSVLVVNRNYYGIMSSRDLSRYSDEVRDSGLLGYAGVNGLAAFEAMFAAFLLALYVYSKKLIVKLAILGLLTTCVYCLLYSFSRGGYFGLLVGIITIGILKSRKLLVIALLLLVGWQALLPSSVQQRISMTTGSAAAGGKFDSSAEERLMLWRDATELFKRNPITGTGFETYQSMGRVGPYRDTHNYYMKVLAETGIVGMVLYLLLLLKLFRVGKDLFYTGTDPFWTSIGLGFLALMATAVVLNFFGDRWTYQQVDGYLWILLGCTIRGLINTQEQSKEEDSEEYEEASLLSEREPAMAGNEAIV